MTTQVSREKVRGLIFDAQAVAAYDRCTDADADAELENATDAIMSLISDALAAQGGVRVRSWKRGTPTSAPSWMRWWRQVMV